MQDAIYVDRSVIIHKIVYQGSVIVQYVHVHVHHLTVESE